MGFGVIRLDGDGLDQMVGGPLVVSLSMGDYPEELQRHGLLRVGFQDLPIEV